MQYDEKFFKKSSNRKAMIMWLVMGVVLTGAYAMEIVKGLRTIEYYIQFLSLCWIPFIAGLLFLKIKGMDNDHYKDIVAVGYGFFYVFVLLTTTSTLAFVYLFPLMSMLILYKNRNYILRCGIANMIALAVNTIINIQRGFNSPSDITQYEIQIASTILCYAGYILAINHMNSSDGAMLGSLKENLEKVVHTVGTVKVGTNDIVDGVSAVRELTDDNIAGANTVVTDMENLTKNNTELQQSTDSSLHLTEAISTQVENVAAMISQMVGLATESTSHAKVSSEELTDVVRLSVEVEKVLQEFKNQFKTMTDQINIIESITMQTNILSLNASVEAARAGESGKGFAVVAGEIRELSSKTKTSSDSIFSALQHLETTSKKMTESITKTLEKVRQVDQSVGKITADTAQMGEHIQAIDSAITEVKASNTKMVDNMHDVSNFATQMTGSITASEETTKDMLEKSIEMTKNVTEIETIVGKLIEELGFIGVMGVKDIRPGLFATVSAEGNECKGRITEVLSDGVLIELPQSWRLPREKVCDFIATVDNSYYKWECAPITPAPLNGERYYKVALSNQPTIANRRKYKRVPLNNAAHITVLDTDYTCHGQMINISEGGYAFKTNDPHIAEFKQKTIRLHIDNFAPFKDDELDAISIRIGEDRGFHSIGCRFLHDNMELKKILKNR